MLEGEGSGEGGNGKDDAGHDGSFQMGVSL